MALSILDNLFERFPHISGEKETILKAFQLIRDSLLQGGKLMVCGNGGSASDADHIVGELMKSFAIPRSVPQKIKTNLRDSFGEEGTIIGQKLEGALPAISLNTHIALISAIANDTDANMIFCQQLYGFARRGDVLWGISTSGNSKNICMAFMLAKIIGVKTLGLTGRDGGQFNKLCDVVINVGGIATSSIQELHLPVYHTLCQMLETCFFGES